MDKLRTGMAGKKGVMAHVEMILAFIIFFSFITFLLLYLKPYEKPVITDSILESAHANFLAEASENLTQIFLEADTGESECFKVDLNLAAEGGSRVVMPLDSNRLVSSGFASGKLVVASGEKGKQYFDVVISPQFSGSEDCDEPELDEGTYNIGSFDTRKILTENGLDRFKENYTNNYDSLKEKLKIPATADFAVVSGSYILQKPIPEKVNVAAQAYVESVLLGNGTIINREFIFKAW